MSKPTTAIAPLGDFVRDVPESGYGGSSWQETEYEHAGLPLSHYVWILRRHVWKIIPFVTAVVFVTFLVSSRMKPVYEATATVDVDRQAPLAIIGQEANRMSTANDADQFLATQIRLIQSDSVLRPVARQALFPPAFPNRGPERLSAV